ncbi:MAG: exodeoxyribonuclease V subunit alpha [Dokdonella sp.]
MADDLLARLQSAEALRALDVEFARLLMRLDPVGGEALGIAAAAASAALADGHACIPVTQIDTWLAAAASLSTNIRLPESAEMLHALRSSPMVGDDVDAMDLPLILDHSERLYLRRYFDYEQRISDALQLRANALATSPDPAFPDPAWLRVQLARWFTLTSDAIDWQAVAVALGVRSRFLVISGGPGTGKTTTVLWLLLVLLEFAQAQGQPLPRIRLAAPTGKAAARLGEAIRIGKERVADADESLATIGEDCASTLHRLLGYRPGDGKFRHDRNNPLPADIVIVDEASMIDLPLMAKLLDALRPDTRLILVGDRAQLASVETGSVLASLARIGTDNAYSPAIAEWLDAATGFALPRSDAGTPLADAMVELQHSHRFGADSEIGRLASAIRAGDTDNALGELHASNASGIDWRHGDAAALTQHVRSHWLEAYRGLLAASTPADALIVANGFRILTAVREGPFGCIAINRLIERALSDSTRNGEWFHGRLVLITANDYRHDLFNGDIGIAFRGDDDALAVWFAGSGNALRAFAPSSLPAHESAFAMTIHKSQGSEFDSVAIVLPDSPNRVLSRELLYTGVTRARSRVSIWADAPIVQTAIERRIERWSGLADLLMPAMERF